jgi:hypothetical protein
LEGGEIGGLLGGLLGGVYCGGFDGGLDNLLGGFEVVGIDMNGLEVSGERDVGLLGGLLGGVYEILEGSEYIGLGEYDGNGDGEGEDTGDLGNDEITILGARDEIMDDTAPLVYFEKESTISCFGLPSYLARIFSNVSVRIFGARLLIIARYT